MPTITACATLAFAAFDRDVALRQIARSGFSRVELTELGAYCRHLPYAEADSAVVAKSLSKYRLTPVALNASPSHNEGGRIRRPDPRCPQAAKAIRERGRWFIRLAAELGIPRLSFPLAPRVPDSEREAVLAAGLPLFRELADVAMDCGVRLNLELPHLYQCTDSLDASLKALDSLAHPTVGATLDSSHWGIINYDLAAFVNALGERLDHVHLRDSAGSDTKTFALDLERTPGRGTVDFTEFGAVLDDSGYDGDVTLELEYREPNLAMIEHEFTRALSHLQACGWSL